MTQGRSPALEPGALLGEGRLTVMRAISTRKAGGVYAVWNRDAWCVMACKAAPSMPSALMEGSILKAMTHPGIVGCYGVMEPGLVLMPLLEGQTLKSLIAISPRGRLTVSDAARLCVQLGGALRHVHDKGFIHLGVDPGNVVVTAGGDPVLCDFASARSIGSRRTAPPPPSSSPYMAPEEFASHECGPEADVFSLGACLYELLTGCLPAQADATPMRRLRLSVPSALDNLVSACLEPNPKFRPELGEVLPMLDGFVTRRPRHWPETFPLTQPRKVQAITHSQAARRGLKVSHVEAAAAE